MWCFMFEYLSLLIILLSISSFDNVLSDEVIAPIVQTSNGKLRGRFDTSQDNMTFFVFQGIPFAKPPIGDLRFHDPQPPNNWNGIRDATYYDPLCIQTISLLSDSESEDCLYLNVYTPELPKPENIPSRLPVMVYFYGGGFLYGNATYVTCGPQFFMDYGVVIVTLNYRVGPFGFLSTGDLTIPGNYGLKDQQLALKWVQDNIDHFGGDRKKVIIFGNSAGSASVGYHILNSKNADLFRGGIMQSGSPLNSWSIQRNPKSFAYLTAQYLNSTINENTHSSEELLQYLRSVSALALKNASNAVTLLDYHLPNIEALEGFFYAPVVEPEHKNAFITANSFGLVENGIFKKAPVLLGINSEESLFEAKDIKSFQELLRQFDENVTYLVNDGWHITSKDEKEAVGRLIQELYVHKGGKFEEMLDKGVKFFSDSEMNNGVIKFASLVSKYIDVYFYQFSYKGVMGNNSISIKGAGDVTHTEELNYIWHRQLPTSDNSDLSKFPVKDIDTQKRILTLWTNFAKTLDPTPTADNTLQKIKWSRFTLDNMVYLDIGQDLVSKAQPKNDTYQQIDRLFKKYAGKPYDTFG